MVMNASLFIPWLLAPIVSVIIAYAGFASGIVPLTTGAQVPWTMPAVISGFLATNSIMGSLLQIVQMIAVGLIYLPFLMMIDKIKEDLKNTEGYCVMSENGEFNFVEKAKFETEAHKYKDCWVGKTNQFLYLINHPMPVQLQPDDLLQYPFESVPDGLFLHVAVITFDSVDTALTDLYAPLLKTGDFVIVVFVRLRQ